MLIRWVNIIVRLNIPLIVYVNDEEVDVIEPDPGEEEALVSFISKVARYGQRDDTTPPGWLKIPSHILTHEERAIARYLMDHGIVKAEEREVI